MSMDHITGRNMGMSLIKAAVENHMDVQGLCIPSLAYHWMRHTKEMDHVSPVDMEHLEEKAMYLTSSGQLIWS